MADINHLISLGIGAPAALLQFLTVGLGFGVSRKVDVAITEALVSRLVLTEAAVSLVTITEAIRA
jgi:hypothetical protein